MAIGYERRGHVACLTIDDPEQANVRDRQAVGMLSQGRPGAGPGATLLRRQLRSAGPIRSCSRTARLTPGSAAHRADR